MNNDIIVLALLTNLEKLDKFISVLETKIDIIKLKKVKKLRFFKNITNLRYDKLNIQHTLFTRLREDATTEIDKQTQE
jgi:hypothetical protein